MWYCLFLCPQHVGSLFVFQSILLARTLTDVVILRKMCSPSVYNIFKLFTGLSGLPLFFLGSLRLALDEAAPPSASDPTKVSDTTLHGGASVSRASSSNRLGFWTMMRKALQPKKLSAQGLGTRHTKLCSDDAAGPVNNWHSDQFHCARAGARLRTVRWEATVSTRCFDLFSLRVSPGGNHCDQCRSFHKSGYG